VHKSLKVNKYLVQANGHPYTAPTPLAGIHTLPLGLYKMLFYFAACVHEIIILALPLPPALPALMQYYCTSYRAIYDAPPLTPLLYAIHHTILAMAIPCKGQATPCRYYASWVRPAAGFHKNSSWPFYARRMGQPTQRATNYTARSNIKPAQFFLHANGQSAPRPGGSHDVGRGAGSHTPSTASESFSLASTHIHTSFQH